MRVNVVIAYYLMGPKIPETRIPAGTSAFFHIYIARPLQNIKIQKKIYPTFGTPLLMGVPYL